jgi:uncharacterized protein YcgL (UPF0745 family)
MEVMSISAEQEMRSAQAEAQQQDFTKPKAELKTFSGGAMVFGEVAEECADILECPESLKPTSKGDASLKLDEAQLEVVKETLANRGYEVVVVEPKIPANISLHGQTATVYGKAAELVSQHLNLPVGKTDKGTAKVKINREQVESVSALLADQGFEVQAQEIENTLKPKVVFREAPDGETYTVYDASANNLAKALEREPDSTPGGRPMLTFERAAYKELKTRFRDELDISTKDLELKTHISTYEVSGRRGAVIVGSAALEAAAALDKEIEWTRPTAKTGKPLPKLKLEESEIQTATDCLESQGYEVSVEAMQQALLKTHAKGAMLFGEPAELIARTLNLKTEPASNGNAMLKLEGEQVTTAKQALEGAGYTVKIEALQHQSGNTAFINTALNGEAIVFGEITQQLASSLNMEVQTSKQSHKPYLKLTAEQIEPAKSALEAQGLKVQIKPLEQPQPKSKPIQKSQGTER